METIVGRCGSSGNRRVTSLVSAHVSYLKSRRSMLEQRRYKQLLTVNVYTMIYFTHALITRQYRRSTKLRSV